MSLVNYSIGNVVVCTAKCNFSNLGRFPLYCPQLGLGISEVKLEKIGWFMGLKEVVYDFLRLELYSGH